MTSTGAVNNVNSRDGVMIGRRGRSGYVSTHRSAGSPASVALVGRSVGAALCFTLVSTGGLFAVLGWDGFPVLMVWTVSSAMGVLGLVAASASLLPASASSGADSRFVGLANHLTVARLVLVAPTVVLILQDRIVAGLVCYATGAMTDVLDGVFARRRQETSRFGTVMDPIADIAATSGVFAVFVARDWVPTWVLVVLIIRYATFFLGAGALLAFAGPLRLRATQAGKIAGVLQALGAMGILALAARGVDWQAELGPWLYPFFGMIFGGVIVSQLVIGIRHLKQGPVHE